MTADDLTAAVARLKAARDLVWGAAPHTQRIAISDHIDAAISALEAAQQDARRYRWLRKRFRTCSLDANGRHQDCDDGRIMRARGPTFDAAIDAAMGEQ